MLAKLAERGWRVICKFLEQVSLGSQGQWTTARGSCGPGEEELQGTCQ